MSTIVHRAAVVIAALAAASANAGKIVYVNASGPEDGDGSSWSTAYRDLQDALAKARDENEDVSEIWVARGKYRPAGENGSRSVSFELVSGVAVYGGFEGDEESRDERNSDPATNGTVLSGELIGDNGNSYSVARVRDADRDTTILDGFTISDGTGGKESQDGGGLVVEGGGLTLRNARVFRNHAYRPGEGEYGGPGSGGGIFARNAKLRLDTVRVSSNSAGNSAAPGGNGGGMYISNCTLELETCEFKSNFAGDGASYYMDETEAGAGGHGGALYASGGKINAKSCSFVGNRAGNGGFQGNDGSGGGRAGRGGDGGAVYVGNGSLAIESSTFEGNRSGDGGNAAWAGGSGGVGGALNVSAGSMTVGGCLFSKNAAGTGGDGRNERNHAGGGGYGGNGGAIHCALSGRALFQECEFSSNTAGDGGFGYYRSGLGGSGGAVSVAAASGVVIEKCEFLDNSAGSGPERPGSVGGGDGGAVVVAQATSTQVAKTRFARNRAGDVTGNTDTRELFDAGDGGAISAAGEIEVVQCQFVGNAAGTGKDRVARGGDGGAIRCMVDVTCVSSSFVGNSAGEGVGGGQGARGGRGGAVASDSDVTVLNTIIHGNRAGDGMPDYKDSFAAAGDGGGVYASTFTMTNCTLTYNSAGDADDENDDLQGRAGGAFGVDVALIRNSILWGNRARRGTLEEQQVALADGSPDIQYSDIEGLDSYNAEGDIDAEPLFFDADGADGMLGTSDDILRPILGSPCRDAGRNGDLPRDEYDLDGDGNRSEQLPVDLRDCPRRLDDPKREDSGKGDAPIVDMGAYECGISRGDLNCDGSVDFDDIDYFVLALSGEEEFHEVVEHCEWLSGDIKGDGEVSLDDIDGFVDCLTNNGCP